MSMPDDFNPNVRDPVEQRCPECGWDGGADDDREFNRLKAALKEIENLGSRTLICGSFELGDDASKAYSLGANIAFEKAAEIARKALGS